MTKRLRQLIDKAGGQADFCRRVWPREVAEANKAKVSKWYKGDSGIRPDEAVTVAKAFDVRAAWLLLGELPEREGVTRTEAKLGDDVAAYVAGEAVTEAGMYEGDTLAYVIASFRSQISGEAILRDLVDRAVKEIQAKTDAVRIGAETLTAIERYEAADKAGEPVDAAGVLAILRRVYNAGPTGLFMPWRPDPGPRAKRETAKESPRTKRRKK